MRERYSEAEPVEDAPAGHPVSTVWRFPGPRLILVEWYDADNDWHNRVMSDELSASSTCYVPWEGIEAIACPSCGDYQHLTVAGTWGGPLNLECPCPSPFAATSSAPWAVNLLKRLILWHVDATSELRHLNDLVIERHTAHQLQEHRTSVLGREKAGSLTQHDLQAIILDPMPDTSLLSLARAVAPLNDRWEYPRARLSRALRDVRLPEAGERPRYAGGPLLRYLIRAMSALADPGTEVLPYTEEGRRLLGTIDRVTADIREQDPSWTQ